MGERWAEKVTIILHRVPEDEGFEDGFEAVTMSGVPHDVSVIGSARDSAECALNHLLDGLRALGFEGSVAVKDATRLGTVERYTLKALTVDNGG